MAPKKLRSAPVAKRAGSIFRLAILSLISIYLSTHARLLLWQDEDADVATSPSVAQRSRTSHDGALHPPAPTITNANVTIAIVVVMDDAHRARLAPNIENLECYAQRNGYRFVSVGTAAHCRARTRDFYFQRQCSVHDLMERDAASARAGEDSARQWYLFLDGDIAVINPNHRIEDYIAASRQGYEGHVIHGLRFHNNAVMAGYYLVRNSVYGREYIKAWSDLYPENNDENSMHYGGANSDAGALYWHLLPRLADAHTPGWRECRELGRLATGTDGGAAYPAFVACFHDVVKRTGCRGHHWDRVSVLPRLRHAVHDGWPFGWRFTDGTFMHHALKNPPMRIPAAHPVHRPAPVAGRWPPPTFPCRRDGGAVDVRRDPYYVNATEFTALVDWAHSMLKKKKQNNPKSWDEDSCVQRGF